MEEYHYLEDDDYSSGSGDFTTIQPINSNEYDAWTEYFKTTPMLDDLTRNLINGFIVIICILGLVGNGMTIYILTNSIKRNSFTTFILNLSIADFGVLTSFIIVAIFVPVLMLHMDTSFLFLSFFLVFELFSFTYSASQFLLTALSLNRCVTVHFPLWHCCHRLPYLPSLVCGLIWALSFLLTVVHFVLHQTRPFGTLPLLYQLIVNGLLCVPFVSVSLWIHAGSEVQRSQRPPLTVIFLALLCFLLFCLPMNVFYLAGYFGFRHSILLTIGMGCAALNSSIRPLLYFLVGRRKRGKGQPKTSYKNALQRVFKDEQDRPEEQQTMNEDQL